MDKDQKSEMAATDRVKTIVEKYIDDFETLDEFADVYKEFNDTSSALDEALGLQEKETAGVLPLVLSKRELMAETIHNYTLRASVLVSSPKYIDLYTAINKSVGYYQFGSKITGVERAKETRKALSENLAIFKNITPLIIEEIDSVIIDYDKNKDDASDHVKTKKALATDAIPKLLARNILAKENIYKLAVSYFNKSKPKLVSELSLAKQVVNTAVRYTSILFNFIDEKTNTPLLNVTVKDESNGKTYHSNEDGDIRIDSHRSGQFHFTISADGKASKDYLAIIKRGIANEFEIKL